MDFIKGTSFFCEQASVSQYSYLAEDIQADVLVIGGGVTGALALWNFTRKGIPCVLVDGGRFGLRSTAITTALLQYELEDNFDELVKQMPVDDVRDAYLIGCDALKEVDDILAQLGNRCDYQKRDTLLLSQTPKDVTALRREYENRVRLGLDVAFYDEKNNPTPFQLKAGVFSRLGGASLNPYLFARQLLAASEQTGARLYENTRVRALEFLDGTVTAQAEYGYQISAKAVVLATGYETSLAGTRNFCTKQITYNIAARPPESLGDISFMARDNKTNYHYFRTLPDGRLVFGGCDSKLTAKGIDASTAEKKYSRLLQDLNRWLVDAQEPAQLDTAFAGIFGVTPDNLGVVGSDETRPNLMYCLGYGANGILFAAIGAKLLAEQYCGRPQPRLRLFDPFRPALSGL